MKEMRIMRAIGDIDDRYIDEAAPAGKKKALRFGEWTKYAGIAAAAVLAIGVGVFVMTRNNGVGVSDPAQTSAVTQPTATVTEPAVTETQPTVMSTELTTSETTGGMSILMVGNPFVEYDTFDEMVKAAGFEVSVPESFGEYKNRSFAVCCESLAEITYRDASGTEGLNIRKSAGDEEDISGTYYLFETMIPAEVDGRKVTMSGISKNDGSVEIFKAVWNSDGYSYSVTAPYDDSDDAPDPQKGLTQAEMEEIIKNVK